MTLGEVRINRGVREYTGHRTGEGGKRMQAKEGGQNFLHGALILAASALIVKLIGAFFKVPLANIIGGSGMGYFMTAYDFFNPVRSLAVAGIPVAVSKMVSEAVATGRFADARRTFRAALGLMCITGVLGTVGVFAFGELFADLAGNPGASAAVLSIAPAIFCCCMISVYRGYYEGQRNMIPTALSQVFEALIRLMCGIGFAGAAYTLGLESYTRDGTIFGVSAGGPAAAEALLSQFTAAAAVWGVSVSTLASMLFLMARHAFVGPDPRIRAADAAEGQNYSALIRELIRTAIPVCLGSLAVSMGSLVDLFTVMNRLGDAVAANPGYFAAEYAAILADGQTLEQLPNYLYGSYTGLALTIFGIVPAVTAVFGVSALPNVAAAWKVRDRERTHRNVSVVLRIVSILAMPAGIGIMLLSQPILELFYSGRQLEIQVAAPLLSVLGIAVIFVSLTAPINSMLQGIGRVDLPVKLMLMGAGIKFVTNFILLRVPQVGIMAAPLGSLLCYGFIVCMSLRAICRETGVCIRFGDTFGKPLFGGIICGLTAWICRYQLFVDHPGKLFTLLSIGIGAIIYFILLFVLKIVTKDDILMMPEGEKIRKTLEKLRLLS